MCLRLANMQAQTALQDAFCNQLLEEGFPPHQIHRVHARISELSTPDIGRISQPHPLQVGSTVEATLPVCDYLQEQIMEALHGKHAIAYAVFVALHCCGVSSFLNIQPYCSGVPAFFAHPLRSALQTRYCSHDWHILVIIYIDWCGARELMR